MSPGRPLHIEDIIPKSITVDDFYVLLAAIAAFIVVVAIGTALGRSNSIKPRLKAIKKRRDKLKADYLAPEKIAKDTGKAPPNWMRAVVDKLANVKGNQLEKLNYRLIQAGYHTKDGAVIFMFVKLVAPIVGLAIGLLFADINWNSPFTSEQVGDWFILILCGYAFSMLPNLLLHNKRQKRYAEIVRALPDTLDLMLICAEAGLSLSAALDRVTKELGNTYPEMADELGFTAVEIGFLPNRSTALTHLAERVDIQEIRGIVNVLKQTEKYGTPIGQALRVLSKDFRAERMLRAEQKAAQLPAIMTIPLIIFILPTLFVIVLAPAVISILNQ